MRGEVSGCLYPDDGTYPCDVKADFESQLESDRPIGWKKRTFCSCGRNGTGVVLGIRPSLKRNKKTALQIQIDGQKNKNLPIVLHCRESMMRTIEMSVLIKMER